MIFLDVPDRISGGWLAIEIEEQTGATGVDVAVVGDQLRVSGEGLNESQVRDVVDAHVPPDQAPDPDDEFAQAVEAASTLDELKAALLGTGGGNARAAARRADR